MRVGLDVFSIRELELTAFGQLDWIKNHGFDGAQFGVLGTDIGRLREIQAYADQQGLYVYASVSSPNPHLQNKSPDAQQAEIIAQVQAAAAAGWHELHSTLGSDANRYRHDSIEWPQQLRDSTTMLQRLAPVLKDTASRINLEPHFDTTTFELVRICETVGPAVCGICLDTANVMLFGEHPVRAAERAAPYTHLTHTKDAFVYFGEKGLMRQTTAPGDGCLDWPAILAALGRYEPDLPLSIEDHKWLFGAEIFESWWHAEQTDLSRKELAATIALAWKEQQRITAGDRMNPDAYEKIPYRNELEDRLHKGRDYLRRILKDLD